MAHDVEIINCTVGGQLHVFPRQGLAAACGAEHATPHPAPGWATLTPGEVHLLAHRPALQAAWTESKPPSYANLLDSERKLLLTQARLASRQTAAPHGLLRAPEHNAPA
jgi:hypothetical protein